MLTMTCTKLDYFLYVWFLCSFGIMTLNIYFIYQFSQKFCWSLFKLPHYHIIIILLKLYNYKYTHIHIKMYQVYNYKYMFTVRLLYRELIIYILYQYVWVSTLYVFLSVYNIKRCLFCYKHKIWQSKHRPPL